MSKRWLTLFLLTLAFSWTVSLIAQDTTPPQVRDAALNAAEAQLGSRAQSWQYVQLNPTDNSNLGCLLVEGTTLPQEVTPYRLTLNYPDGNNYVVHVSADGTRTQLCDPKFGDAIQTSVTTDDAETCTAQPAATLTVYGAPSTSTNAVATMNSTTQYNVIGKSSDDQWVQVAFDGVVGWAEALSVVLSTACDSGIAITGYTVPEYAGEDCFISPAGAFSNVRQTPDISGALLAQIFENSIYQATAVNQARDWYYITPGWISITVLTRQGNCDSLPVNNALIGQGFPESTPIPTTQPDTNNNIVTTNPTPVPTQVAAAAPSTDVNEILNQLQCPAGFPNFLEPRIRIGDGTAAIEEGGLPNTLRDYPSTDDTISNRLGTIQPSRTLNRVVAGPVCNEVFVWWYVEIDGTRGWTAESNFALDQYYITPTTDTVPTNETVSIPTATPAPAVADTSNRVVDENADYNLGSDIIVMEVASDGTNLYTGTQRTNLADTSGFVDSWALETGSLNGSANFVGRPSFVEVIGNQFIAFALDSGVVSVRGINGNSRFIEIRDVFDSATPITRAYAFNDDATQFIFTDCADNCNNYTVNLYDLNTREILWSRLVSDAEITDIAVSGNFIVTASNDGVRLWDRTAGSRTAFYQDTLDTGISSVAINPVNPAQMLIGGCADFAQVCWSGRVGVLSFNGGDSLTLQGVLNLPNVGVTDVQYTPDGNQFVAVTNNQLLVVYDAGGNELERFSLPVTSTIADATITPDGRVLVVADTAGNVYTFLLV